MTPLKIETLLGSEFTRNENSVEFQKELNSTEKNKTALLSIESWLVNDGILNFMVYEIIPI